MFRRAFSRLLSYVSQHSPTAQAQKRDLLRRLLAEDRYAQPGRLNRSEHQAYSQGGEDGIVREIFRRIGTTSKRFVEIGVGNGLENNTTLLLCDGWSGIWVEGSPENCAAIRAHFGAALADGRLRLVEGLVTAENAAALVREPLASLEFDLLSLDIDRNTYYVWEALRELRPRVVVIEYNAMFPADMAWKVEYDAAKWWSGTSYFGASLKALELLGASMGYSLVGCDTGGVNAFFVRSDLCGSHFCAPFTAENHYEPVRYYLLCKPGNPRSFGDG
ncbi:MAG TPA: hypothetical protein VFB32_03315 [Rudaea sp.]|nr:hypothetical protein [Rudaea sp.]